METLIGVVSRVSRGSAVHGMMVGGRGAIQSHNTLTFSVGKNAVEYRSKAVTSIEDGDRIAVVGPRKKNGMIQAYAIKNLENGVIMSEGGTAATILGVALIVCGLATLVAVVGVFFLVIGVRSFRAGTNVEKAIRIVSAITPEQVSAVA